MKSASCVTQLSCVKPVTNVKKCCLKSTCRGETSKLLANVAGPGCRSESSSNFERGLHPPLSDPAKPDKISNSHKLLCKSPQEPLLAGGIAAAYRQKCSRTGPHSKISGIFQPTIFSPKTQQVETYNRSEQTKFFPQGGEIQNGDTGSHQNVYFHIPRQEQSRKYLRFHLQGRTYQFKALPFGLSTAPMAIHKDIRLHQYLDDWLVTVRSHQVCLQHTQDLVERCQKLGWLVNLEKSELEPKQVFNFVGYQFDPHRTGGRTCKKKY